MLEAVLIESPPCCEGSPPAWRRSYPQHSVVLGRTAVSRLTRGAVPASAHEAARLLAQGRSVVLVDAAMSDVDARQLCCGVLRAAAAAAGKPLNIICVSLRPRGGEEQCAWTRIWNVVNEARPELDSSGGGGNPASLPLTTPSARDVEQWYEWQRANVWQKPSISEGSIDETQERLVDMVLHAPYKCNTPALFVELEALVNFRSPVPQICEGASAALALWSRTNPRGRIFAVCHDSTIGRLFGDSMSQPAGAAAANASDDGLEAILECFRQLLRQAPAIPCIYYLLLDKPMEVGKYVEPSFPGSIVWLQAMHLLDLASPSSLYLYHGGSTKTATQMAGLRTQRADRVWGRPDSINAVNKELPSPPAFVRSCTVAVADPPPPGLAHLPLYRNGLVQAQCVLAGWRHGFVACNAALLERANSKYTADRLHETAPAAGAKHSGGSPSLLSSGEAATAAAALAAAAATTPASTGTGTWAPQLAVAVTGEPQSPMSPPLPSRSPAASAAASPYRGAAARDKRDLDVAEGDEGQLKAQPPPSYQQPPASQQQQQQPPPTSPAPKRPAVGGLDVPLSPTTTTTNKSHAADKHHQQQQQQQRGGRSGGACPELEGFLLTKRQVEDWAASEQLYDKGRSTRQLVVGYEARVATPATPKPVPTLVQALQEAGYPDSLLAIMAKAKSSSQTELYEMQAVVAKGGEILDHSCSCPYSQRHSSHARKCKHLVAMLLLFVQDPEAFLYKSHSRIQPAATQQTQTPVSAEAEYPASIWAAADPEAADKPKPKPQTRAREEPAALGRRRKARLNEDGDAEYDYADGDMEVEGEGLGAEHQRKRGSRDTDSSALSPLPDRHLRLPGEKPGDFSHLTSPGKPARLLSSEGGRRDAAAAAGQPAAARRLPAFLQKGGALSAAIAVETKSTKKGVAAAASKDSNSRSKSKAASVKKEAGKHVADDDDGIVVLDDDDEEEEQNLRSKKKKSSSSKKPGKEQAAAVAKAKVVSSPTPVSPGQKEKASARYRLNEKELHAVAVEVLHDESKSSAKHKRREHPPVLEIADDDGDTGGETNDRDTTHEDEPQSAIAPSPSFSVPPPPRDSAAAAAGKRGSAAAAEAAKDQPQPRLGRTRSADKQHPPGYIPGVTTPSPYVARASALLREDSGSGVLDDILGPMSAPRTTAAAVSTATAAAAHKRGAGNAPADGGGGGGGRVTTRRQNSKEKSEYEKKLSLLDSLL
eukprot:m.108232 g.108232  ORF g.108232 m.108232 type:complete len:1220 (+) comp15860_c0_seq3:86-3745(+)